MTAHLSNGFLTPVVYLRCRRTVSRNFDSSCRGPATWLPLNWLRANAARKSHTKPAEPISAEVLHESLDCLGRAARGGTDCALPQYGGEPGGELLDRRRSAGAHGTGPVGRGADVAHVSQ